MKSNIRIVSLNHQYSKIYVSYSYIPWLSREQQPPVEGHTISNYGHYPFEYWVNYFQQQIKNMDKKILDHNIARG